MTTRGQQAAVALTCLLAAMTNAGSVTAFALGVYLLPGVIVAAAVGSVLAARRLFGAALLLGALLALGWAELVNVWSGTADGPAARATFIASGCTLVAVVVAQWRSPALFLLAVAGSVCGALLLGAGGEVRIVVVVTAVVATLTLGSLERSRRNWTAQPRRGPTPVLLSLLVGAVAAGIVVLQAQLHTRQPDAVASGLAYPGIKPPWTDPLGTTAKTHNAPEPRLRASFGRPHPPDETTPPRVAPTHATHPRRVAHPTSASPSRIWWYALAALVLAVALALLARVVAVRLAWRRLRRRLAAGAVAEQITGAWAWARLRLEACRLPLPAALSPDVLAAGTAGTDLPANVLAPLQVLATSTTTAAFAWDQPFDPSDATAAWLAASEAEASARELLTRRARVGLAFRSPAPRTGTR